MYGCWQRLSNEFVTLDLVRNHSEQNQTLDMADIVSEVRLSGLFISLIMAERLGTLCS